MIAWVNVMNPILVVKVLVECGNVKMVSLIRLFNQVMASEFDKYLNIYLDIATGSLLNGVPRPGCVSVFPV